MDGSFNARPDDELVLSHRDAESGEFPITHTRVDEIDAADPVIEQIMSLWCDESDDASDEVEEVDPSDPVILPLNADARSRLALRDRLVRRVLDEEFLSIKRMYGEDALYMVRFETDPLRICERIGLDCRAKYISGKIERINSVLGLNKTERASSNYESTTFQYFVSQARHDWLRGKIQSRAKERRLREEEGKPSPEDLLWHRLR